MTRVKQLSLPLLYYQYFYMVYYIRVKGHVLSHTQQWRAPHKCGVRYYGYYSNLSRGRR
jgi:hypothetical protein